MNIDDSLYNNKPILLKMKFTEYSWNQLKPIIYDDEIGSDANNAQNLNQELIEPYNMQYNFSLFDNSNDDNETAAVDAPEWLVFQGVGLDQLAKRHGLKIELKKNFHEFLDMELNGKDSSRKRLVSIPLKSNLLFYNCIHLYYNRNQLEYANVFDVTGTIPIDEWKLAG